MTAKLTDKMSVRYIEITDLSFRHKYAAFSAPSYVFLIQLIYMTELSSYEVKNLKNTVNYENS